MPRLAPVLLGSSSPSLRTPPALPSPRCVAIGDVPARPPSRVLRAIAANTPRAAFASLRCPSVTCPPARPRTRERCGSLISLLLVPIASFQALGDGGGIHSSFETLNHSSFETFQRQNSATFEVSFRSFLFPFSCSLLRLNSSSPLSKHLDLLSSTLTKVYENQKCFCGSW